MVFLRSDGLVIALVMKYADNILKGFATSVAICFTAIASVLMGDIPRCVPCGLVSMLVRHGSGMIVCASVHECPFEMAPTHSV